MGRCTLFHWGGKRTQQRKRTKRNPKHGDIIKAFEILIHNRRSIRMKFKFRNIRLSKANKERLDVINSIIKEYQAQSYVLTLRQLYYQLVSRDVVPNVPAEYNKLSRLLKEGRMAGIVDWEAIEDRLRRPKAPASWDSPKEILESAERSFEMPRMRGQDNYIEVWVEKDALSGVLSRVTSKYHIPILVNRGYSSASAMYDSYRRFKSALENGQDVHLLYLGDYDPSGLDMIRDITERTHEFFLGNAYNMVRNIEAWEIEEGEDAELFNEYPRKEVLDDGGEFDVHRAQVITKLEGGAFTVHPIALTLAQIKKYNPPPNPAKRTDPRSADFIRTKGATSWEVDALKPEVLHQLLVDNIERLVDMEQYEEMLKEEKKQKGILKNLISKL